MSVKDKKLVILVKQGHKHEQGWTGSPNFGGIFLRGPKKKIADLKKRSLNKNSKGLLPLPKQKISTN
jgi:hypothetical protein